MLLLEVLIKNLIHRNIDYIFGGPEYLLDPSKLDLLSKFGTRYEGLKDEKAAIYAAISYARLSKQVGFCFLNSEMSIYNCIGGMADAYRCRVPLITMSYSKDHLKDQHLTLHITKYTGTIHRHENVLQDIIHAVNIATTPPYGPVHLIIERELLDYCIPEPYETLPLITKPNYDLTALQCGINKLNHVTEGIIFVGEGCRNHVKELKEAALILRWPVITTHSAKDLLDDDFPYYIGYYDTYHQDCLAKCLKDIPYEAVLFLGTSLGPEYDPVFHDLFIKNKETLHIDYVAQELVKTYDTNCNVHCDVQLFLNELIRSVGPKEISYDLKDYACSQRFIDDSPFSQLVYNISRLLPEKSVVFINSGPLRTQLMRNFYIQKHTIVDYGVLYDTGCNTSGAYGGFLAKPDYCKVYVWDMDSFMKDLYDVYHLKDKGILFVVFNTHPEISSCDIARSIGIRHIRITNLEDMRKITDHMCTYLDSNVSYLVEIVN